MGQDGYRHLNENWRARYTSWWESYGLSSEPFVKVFHIYLARFFNICSIQQKSNYTEIKNISHTNTFPLESPPLHHRLPAFLANLLCIFSVWMCTWMGPVTHSQGPFLMPMLSYHIIWQSTTDKRQKKFQTANL